MSIDEAASARLKNLNLAAEPNLSAAAAENPSAIRESPRTSTSFKPDETRCFSALVTIAIRPAKESGAKTDVYNPVWKIAASRQANTAMPRNRFRATWSWRGEVVGSAGNPVRIAPVELK